MLVASPPRGGVVRSEDEEWCEPRENDCSKGFGSSSNLERTPTMGWMGGR
jgi:hypothetical protein